MIFFLEDDDNIRKLVCYALHKEGYDIEGFEKPSLFWTRLDEEIPQLILLDIMLPEEDGLSVLKKLQNNKKHSDIPVIMITAKNSEFDKATGLDLGADDYIAKPFGMVEFVSRVRAVLRRYEKTKSKNNIYKNNDFFVDFEKHIIKVSGESIELSYKEYTLLSVLLRADGNVVTRDELLTKVWGEYYEESRTLDVHIRKLRVKLKQAGACIKTVKNIGYQFVGDHNE
ncbi:MAG: response regulator transcription factor [Clostridium sp.]|nr:response regulator transcription factor [Clostridium sp.]